MSRRHNLYAHYRYARYLLREFRWPLAIFIALVLVGGAVLKLAYHREAAGPLSYGEACYAIFALVFFQPTLPFPSEWYIEPLFFLIPVVGLGALGDSLVRLGYLVITRKRKLLEWQIMHASTMREHIVVVGVGKVGYKIIKDLLAFREGVVAVERNMDSPLVSDILDMGVPVIHGDGRFRKTLEQAGTAQARAVILATDDDLANIDAALTAREIQPHVRVVLRLFDETMANKVAGMFKMPAISPSATSAAEFIAAATERSILRSFSLDGGETLHVTDVSIDDGSPLAGKDVGTVQQEYDVDIVMHKRGESVLINPDHALHLQPHDRLLVIAPIDKVAGLEKGKKK